MYNVKSKYTVGSNKVQLSGNLGNPFDVVKLGALGVPLGCKAAPVKRGRLFDIDTHRSCRKDPVPCQQWLAQGHKCTQNTRMGMAGFLLNKKTHGDLFTRSGFRRYTLP